MTSPERWLPMLASRDVRHLTGLGWVAEPKWDGWRVLLHVQVDGVRLRSRRGLLLPDRWQRWAQRAVSTCGVPPGTTLDGELVVTGANGRQQHALVAGARGVPSLLLFDVLRLDGELLLSAPLSARRAWLDTLALPDPDAALDGLGSTPQHMDVLLLLALTAGHAMEGVVLKRLASRYVPGRRSTDWVKLRHPLTAAQAVHVQRWLAGSAAAVADPAR